MFLRLLSIFAIFIVIFAFTITLFRKDEYKYNKLTKVVSLTHFATPAFDVSYFEPRLRRFQSHYFTPYPTMIGVDRLGLVYKNHYLLKSSYCF